MTTAAPASGARQDDARQPRPPWEPGREVGEDRAARWGWSRHQRLAEDHREAAREGRPERERDRRADPREWWPPSPQPTQQQQSEQQQQARVLDESADRDEVARAGRLIVRPS